MLYDLRLRLATHYGSPAGAGRHIARVTPRDVPGAQRVLACTVHVEPEPHELWDRVDFFGNREVEFAFRAPHDAVAVSLRAKVDRLAEGSPPRSSTPLRALGAQLATIRDLGSLSPLHFLAPSALVPRAAAFQSWAHRRVGLGMSAFDAAWTVNRGLHEEMRFDGSATEVDTPALEAFEKRHGVCQDFSHVMIGCLRSLGIPAGYVSGLIRTTPPPGRPRLEGADAMHAWVMAWCGAAAGWVEFDPTNDRLAGPDHILVARGRDYADVTPMKGVLRIAGGQAPEQAVDVIPLEEPTPVLLGDGNPR